MPLRLPQIKGDLASRILKIVARMLFARAPGNRAFYSYF
jgi:hypothetical protein